MQTNKLNFLEGIRGVAAFVVVLHHLRLAFRPQAETEWLAVFADITGNFWLAHILHSLVNVLFDGNLAVYIFWFMSGYVISIKLFQPDVSKARAYLVAAVSKRYFRLAIPVLGSVLLAYVLLKSGLMYNHQLAAALNQSESETWIGQLYAFEPDILQALKSGIWEAFFDYDAETTYNGVIWTMNPELYGSFMVFLLFGVFGRSQHRYPVYLLVFAAAILLRHNWLATFMAALLLCDFDFALPQTNKWKATIIRLEAIIFTHKFLIILIMLVWMLIGGKRNFYGIADIVLSFVMVYTVIRTIFLRQFFQWRPFVWLGKISFSLYLIHLPLICSLTGWLYLNLNLPHLYKVLVASGVTIVVALAASAVYNRFVDSAAIIISGKIGHIFSPPAIPDTKAKSDAAELIINR